MASVNPESSPDNWFIDRIATDEFLNDNREAVLIVMGFFSSTGTPHTNGFEGMCIGHTTA
jgi:hypothetical protein